MIGSLAVFTGAALVGGMAWSFPVLVAARTVQGLAGGSLVPVSLAVVAYAYPAHRRGWVMGMRSIVRQVGGAFGVAALSSILRADIGGLDPSSASDRPAIQQGFNHVFWVMVGVAAIIFVLALPLRRPVAIEA